jgi:hypothetical protein
MSAWVEQVIDVPCAFTNGRAAQLSNFRVHCLDLNLDPAKKASLHCAWCASLQDKLEVVADGESLVNTCLLPVLTWGVEGERSKLLAMDRSPIGSVTVRGQGGDMKLT